MEKQVWGQIIKSPSHGHIDRLRSRPFYISEIKIWFLDAMTTGTSYQKHHCWGSPFPNYTSKYLPNSQNRTVQLGKHVEKADDTSEQSSNLLNKPVRLPKKKKNQNFKKRRLTVSPSKHVVERMLQSQKTSALVPILILARKHLGFISIFAKQRNGTSLAVRFTFWHQNALLLKFKNTGS